MLLFASTQWCPKPLMSFHFLTKTNCDQFCSSVEGRNNREGFIFLSDDRPHKNHLRLLDAWEKLKTEFEIAPKLHLTIPNTNTALVSKIEQLNALGCDISNHGLMDRDEALQLIASCEYSIFPSLLETLGLGMIEGSLLGTKVICSNDKTLEHVIQPSASFDPMSVDSIASTVFEAIKDCPTPEIRLKNEIDQLLQLLAAGSSKPESSQDTGKVKA